VLGEPRKVGQLLLDEDGAQRGQQPGVAARAHLQVEIGELGGLGTARVDHDQRPGRILGDVPQRQAAWGKLCDCQGFLPTNTATSQCSKSPRTGVPT